MFTVAACFAVAGLAWYGQRGLSREREAISTFADDLVRQSVVFAREDLKLVTLILAGILIMLGIIADRVG